MAKATYTSRTMEMFLNQFFSGELVLTVESSTKASFLDDETASLVLIKGDKLKGSKGDLTGGTVTTVVFANMLGEALSTVRGEFDAKQLSAAAEKGIDRLLQFTFAGNDEIKDQGSASNALLGYAGRDLIKAGDGGDLLDGGAGDGDLLFGGDGVDVFRFRKGNGHDVIKDFEVGNNAIHDIVTVNVDYKLTSNNDGDAVLSINNSDKLTFADVSKNELEDFHIMFG